MSELNSMIETGKTNTDEFKKHSKLYTTYSGSQAVNTYTNPVNLVAPRTSEFYEKWKEF